MRSPDADHYVFDVCARHPLRRLRGAVDRRGCGAQFRDQPLPHSARGLNPVAAIAQHAILQLRHQNADLAAARVQHCDQVLLPGIHLNAPCSAETVRLPATLPVVHFVATGRFAFAAAAGLIAVAAAFCVCGFVCSAPLDSVDAFTAADPAPAASLAAAADGAASPGCISSTTCRS